MKPFLLLLSLLISVPVFSQNYRTLSINQELFFDFKDAGNYNVFEEEDFTSRVIFTDSFKVFPTEDIMIYHRLNHEFETEYDASSNTQYGWDSCSSEIDTGFLSYQTLLQANGTDVYFNRFHDSIFIQTHANLNDTWIFYQNADGSYFEATVSNISTENVLGLSDSVKTITLQAKDSLGNNIISPYDTLNIKISQHYGLVKGFNFFRFPYGVTFWGNKFQRYYQPIELIGLPQHNLGVKNLTVTDVYDYDIGDEFHWYSKQSGGDWWSYYEDYVYDMITITNKEYSVNGDSVYYDMYLEKYRFAESYQPYVGSSYFFDTLYIGNSTIGYDLTNSKINTYTLHQDSDSIVTWIQTKDGKQKYMEFGDNVMWNEYGCFITEWHYGGASTFHKGIGETGWWGTRFEAHSRDFIYYNKNGNIYGTPLNIDSLSTVSTDEIVKNDFEINLKVFPNPTNNLLNFQFTEPIQNAEIRIYSSIGQLMLNQNINDTNMQFDVFDWTKGIYFYGIYVEGEVVKQGQVIVQD